MKNNISTKKEPVGLFLTQRFLLAVAIFFTAEEILEHLIPYLLRPLFINVIQVNANSYDSITVGKMIRIVINEIISLLTNVLPNGIAARIDVFSSDLLDVHIVAPPFVAKYGLLMSEIYFLTIAIIVLIALLIYLVPLILAVGWYIQIIQKKMDELHQLDVERQKEYERRRNLLFSDITHDIKTPITTVVGYSKAMADGMISDPKKQKEYLMTMYNKSMRISELITMLFEFVKLDSDGFQLHPQKCDLAELVRENVIMLLMDFEERDIELDIDIPDDVCLCEVDKVQMSRVVTNLLTNSIRYIADGHQVQVIMKTVQVKGNEFYKICVADDGLKIEEEFAKHIFDPFSRSDAARQTTSGGSGLGLSIAHKVAQMHGGDLTLNLNYGQGYEKAFEILVPVLKEHV